MFEFFKKWFGNSKEKRTVYTGEDFRIKNIQDMCRDQFGIFQPYILKIVDKGLYKLSLYLPNPRLKISYARYDWRTDNYIELFPRSSESADGFADLFDETLKIVKGNGAQVYNYTLQEYKNMKLFISQKETSGFAIKSDGEINSIFSSAKGSLHAMIELAILRGGNKLYCFDTFLLSVFKRHGFKEVKRSKWNETIFPDILNKEYFKHYNNTEPDIVYLELNFDRNKKIS